MRSEKSVGLSFRVTPQFKTLLETAAKQEKRSLTNMLEVVVADYCQRKGIRAEDSLPESAVTEGESK